MFSIQEVSKVWMKRMNVCSGEGDLNVFSFPSLLATCSGHTPLPPTPPKPPPQSFAHEASHEWQQRTPPGILVMPPSGRGQGLPSGPQSVPTLPVWCCLMSAYEQTFDCQVALPPRHADQAGFCRCCSNLGASKGGLGFPK